VRGGEEGELIDGEGREKGRWKMRGEERESGRRNRRKG
jgi:hypothetical protein